ncbi:hypothetical protein ACFOZ0_26475 [Streptomyces yaanensis]|uniref:Uncharacterized protein n=1 Tax=Streptomyces yaanensis TaxID=1142239 RepID=A0ABV7SIF3_9ACTN|nr:hypothetical protein [Streptomyces sp. CGMCC 4.7035]WNC01719.1 hypothetical protein Q2K21_28680 [Streptomyces sp. CGMCC 4.7035]
MAILPLSTLAFAPKRSLGSTAKAGAKLRVPLVVSGYAADKGVKSLTVEASYDGGDTWKKAHVITAHGKSSITLHHPASAGRSHSRARCRMPRATATRRSADLPK